MYALTAACVCGTVKPCVSAAAAALVVFLLLVCEALLCLSLPVACVPASTAVEDLLAHLVY